MLKCGFFFSSKWLSSNGREDSLLMEQIYSGAGLDAFHADDWDQRGMQHSDEKCLIIS